MKKSSFGIIILIALLLGAGFATKDSELVKAYVPVLLEQLQAGEAATEPVLVTETPKAEAKDQAAAKADADILAITALDVGQGDSILLQMQGRIY
ncbi:hypothetical protein [uncultured Phascolarctobacterium sp.]|uniref:hypothetical protein n=1 Tax=uncultured Phascolarctobacterium sp. TaxID=512296 RepID=UPI0025F2A11F|nr:hypothetical protein [uncultured Phascolarctobacterium sp.]